MALHQLPFDLTCEVFNRAGLVAAACAGMACKELYAQFREWRKHANSTTGQVIPHKRCVCMGGRDPALGAAWGHGQCFSFLSGEPFLLARVRGLYNAYSCAAEGGIPEGHIWATFLQKNAWELLHLPPEFQEALAIGTGLRGAPEHAGQWSAACILTAAMRREDILRGACANVIRDRKSAFSFLYEYAITQSIRRWGPSWDEISWISQHKGRPVGPVIHALHELGVPMPAKLLAVAAHALDVEALRVLRACGCEWGVCEYLEAISETEPRDEDRVIDVIRVLNELGCEPSGREADLAYERGMERVLDELNRIPSCYPEA